MPTITFNAFSFLQQKLRRRQQPCTDVQMTVPENCSVADLIRRMALAPSDVEVAFVNGRVVPFRTILNDQDRIGLVPPGTPGPYRVLLGFKNRSND